MYIAPGLLYLHVPRTAGTFVTNVLERTGIGTRNVEGLSVHDGVRRVPARLRENRIVVGTVRDPWSWYVSLYASYRNHKTGNLTGPLAELVGNQANFQKALDMMTRPKGQATIVAPKLSGAANAVDPRIGRTIDRAGIGLWSWYIISTFCEDPIEATDDLAGQLGDDNELPWSIDVAIDVATVEVGLARVLEAVNGPKAAETIGFLQKSSPVNETPAEFSWRGVRPSGRPSPKLWDEGSIRTVEEVDGYLIRRFGFDKPVGGRPEIHALSAATQDGDG